MSLVLLGVEIHNECPDERLPWFWRAARLMLCARRFYGCEKLLSCLTVKWFAVGPLECAEIEVFVVRSFILVVRSHHFGHVAVPQCVQFGERPVDGPPFCARLSFLVGELLHA